MTGFPSYKKPVYVTNVKVIVLITFYQYLMMQFYTPVSQHLRIIHKQLFVAVVC